MQDKSTPASDFLARLNLALQQACVSRTELARQLGIAKSTITRWRHGSLPRPEVIEDIARITGVRREWLSAGIGEMTPPQETERLQEASEQYAKRSDGDMLEELLTSMSIAQLHKHLNDYMNRADRDKEDRRAVSMARLLLSEINLRAKTP